MDEQNAKNSHCLNALHNFRKWLMEIATRPSCIPEQVLSAADSGK